MSNAAEGENHRNRLLFQKYGKRTPYDYKGPKCVAGCKNYPAYETKHDPTCPFYPGSLSEQYDKQSQPTQESVAVAFGEWIAVEKKPEPKTWVLVCYGNYVEMGQYVPDEEFDPNDEDSIKEPEWTDLTSEYIEPTHWMPLPNPPHSPEYKALKQ